MDEGVFWTKKIWVFEVRKPVQELAGGKRGNLPFARTFPHVGSVGMKPVLKRALLRASGYQDVHREEGW